MKSLVYIFLGFLFLAPLSVSASILGPDRIDPQSTYPFKYDEFAAAIVVDVNSGMILYEFNGSKPWSAASLTKLMSSSIYLACTEPSDDKIVSLLSADEVGGGRLRVASGATLSTQDLMYSTVTASANNTATAMARLSGLSYSSFIQKMNERAFQYDMRQSTFVDPSGMDPENITSARDMAKLAWRAFDDPWIMRTATTAEYTFKIQNTGEIKTIHNTNDLLIDPEHGDVYVTGGKTGFLYESRYNLVVRMRPTESLNDNDRHVLVVVLGAPTRDSSFTSAKALAKWTWDVYRW
ncbi:serine hydrolase [Patescibacteria group bacterium]|nr:serine hydrolase [Patescibacteria group bacterium]